MAIAPPCVLMIPRDDDDNGDDGDGDSGDGDDGDSGWW